MVGHGGSSAGSYLAEPTSPIPSHCASIVVTSTVRVKNCQLIDHVLLQDLVKYLEPVKLASILLSLLDKNMYKESWQLTLRAALQVITAPSLLSSVPALGSRLLPLLMGPCPFSPQLRATLPGAHPLLPTGCEDNWDVVKRCAQRLTALEPEQFDQMVSTWFKQCLI